MSSGSDSCSWKMDFHRRVRGIDVGRGAEKIRLCISLQMALASSPDLLSLPCDLRGAEYPWSPHN